MTDRTRIHIAERDPLNGDAPPEPTMADLAEKIDRVVSVVQSQGETMLEMYTEVQSMRADVNKIRGEYLARIPPGYRWATLACLALIAVATLRIAFGDDAPAMYVAPASAMSVAP